MHDCRYLARVIFSLVYSALMMPLMASQERLDVHFHYDRDKDTWEVHYRLSNPVNRVVFSGMRNIDRSELFKIDVENFTWDTKGAAQTLKRQDGTSFKHLKLSFPSYYDFIQKEYTPNIRFSDGGVMLFTHHFTLSTDSFNDRTSNFSGKLVDNTQLHFHSPGQTITFLGEVFENQASWQANQQGTYVYFGKNKVIETPELVAIVDTGAPKWIWESTRKLLPQLFTYYRKKTGQALSFRPFVFLNYDKVDGDFSDYSGSTLPGLVQLSVLGRRWQSENKKQFNRLFHFIAHEAAHFWNGNMFSYENSRHSWMHEGGADVFANFAMLEFGLISRDEMLKKFEIAANQCLLNKSVESLAESGAMWRSRNYYSCGAVMGLASHVAVKEKHADKTIFDLWSMIFARSSKTKKYNQALYFMVLDTFLGSRELSKKLAHFSDGKNIDNAQVLISLFANSELRAKLGYKYPHWGSRRWGDEIIRRLMSMHCKRMSIGQYDDYALLYPIAGCKPFERQLEVRFVEGLDIRLDGITAYTRFREKCATGKSVSLQNRKQILVAKIQCVEEVAPIKPYLSLVKQ